MQRKSNISDNIFENLICTEEEKNSISYWLNKLQLLFNNQIRTLRNPDEQELDELTKRLNYLNNQIYNCVFEYQTQSLKAQSWKENFKNKTDTGKKHCKHLCSTYGDVYRFVSEIEKEIQLYKTVFLLIRIYYEKQGVVYLPAKKEDASNKLIFLIRQLCFQKDYCCDLTMLKKKLATLEELRPDNSIAFGTISRSLIDECQILCIRAEKSFSDWCRPFNDYLLQFVCWAGIRNIQNCTILDEHPHIQSICKYYTDAKNEVNYEISKFNKAINNLEKQTKLYS